MVDKDQLSPNLVQPAVDIRSKREGWWEEPNGNGTRTATTESSFPSQLV